MDWKKEHYYQSSESEAEEPEAIKKLQERVSGIQEEDLMPDLENQELDFAELNQDEQLELIQRHSPELLPTLSTYKQALQDFKNLKALQNYTLTPEGKAYFTTKSKLLKLLFMHLSFYVMAKAKGLPMASHPVLQSIKQIKKLLKKQQTSKEIPQLTEEPQQVHTNEVRKAEEVLKTKGIKKKRKKIERNVRVKNKMKFLKKLKKRRATYGHKEKDFSGVYSGETTGIRKDLVKSVKLS